MHTSTRWVYYFTVFITGAAVLVVEIVATRILAPYYGSSTFVFSGILTSVLTALSIGYYVGGVLADRYASSGLLYGSIFVSGVLLLSIRVIDTALFQWADLLSNKMAGLLIISLALFFLPAFLLGIVSPHIIKLQSLAAAHNQVGSTVGRVFFWGTIGSIAGSLFGGFYFVPVWGVSQTLTVWGVLLVVVGISGAVFCWLTEGHNPRPSHMWFRKFWMYGIGILISVYLVSSSSNVAHFKYERVLYEADGVYSHILVYERQVDDGTTVRHLKRDTNNSSASFVQSDALAYSYSKFVEYIPLLKQDAERFLLIGGGAYSMPRSLVSLYPDIIVDVSEIEPRLFDIAQRYFGLTDITRINNYVQDGRVFLADTEETYDVIFEDAFGAELSLPVHLVTREFYELAQQRLAPGGILMVNYAGMLQGRGAPSVTGSTIKTIMSVFPNTKVYALNKEAPRSLQNIVIVARNGDAEINLDDAVLVNASGQEQNVRDLEIPTYYFSMEDEVIFTDDVAPLEYLWLKQS